ncbi:helix-hairpin-helix domain-containing protein [Shouchella shacheensis]|uniref:helix-hairpin-helix domain-containing protein n=1 Tax=Shouchella shacheensis TaxID=1649580 RepID=UPI00073FCE15|nr:helix-hairpin-helix domain-containing protein [Shouchella shacheensis]
MKKWKPTQIHFYIASLIAAVLFVFLIVTRGESGSGQEGSDEWIMEAAEEEDSSASLESEEKASSVIVDVKGAVHAPGVYELDAGSRVHEAILMAGGLAENAEERALNLAVVLTDEMLLYVPEEGEEDIPAAGSTNTNGSDAALVNINTAEEAELLTLPGIGPAKASAILSYREEHGPFEAPEDLVQVNGIGEKSFQQLSELITVK